MLMLYIFTPELTPITEKSSPEASSVDVRPPEPEPLPARIKEPEEEVEAPSIHGGSVVHDDEMEQAAVVNVGQQSIAPETQPSNRSLTNSILPDTNINVSVEGTNENDKEETNQDLSSLIRQGHYLENQDLQHYYDNREQDSVPRHGYMGQEDEQYMEIDATKGPWRNKMKTVAQSIVGVASIEKEIPLGNVNVPSEQEQEATHHEVGKQYTAYF